MFRPIESVAEIAVDVELGREPAPYQDWDDDFTLHEGRAGKRARIFGKVVYYDSLSAASSSAAQSGAQWNASVRCKAAYEGSDQENVGAFGSTR